VPCVGFPNPAVGIASGHGASGSAIGFLCQKMLPGFIAKLLSTPLQFGYAKRELPFLAGGGPHDARTRLRLSPTVCSVQSTPGLPLYVPISQAW
jgi:hypothetical protein